MRARAPLAVVLVLGLGLALAVVGCGSGPNANAQAGLFMTRILREEISGQWARQWADLHPGHQELITRGQYVACSRAMGTDIGVGRASLTVRAVRDEPIHVRGVPQRTAKVVTIRLREKGTAGGITYRLHAVRVGGRWTWILGPAFLRALARGRCLDGSPVAPPV